MRRSRRLSTIPVPKTAKTAGHCDQCHPEKGLIDPIAQAFICGGSLRQNIVNIGTSTKHPLPFVQADGIADLVRTFIGGRLLPNISMKIAAILRGLNQGGNIRVIGPVLTNAEGLARVHNVGAVIVVDVKIAILAKFEGLQNSDDFLLRSFIAGRGGDHNMGQWL